MGEPVTVIEKPTARPGYVRFETNRSFTGMGHERYLRGEPIHRVRPVDVVARQLLETGRVEEVHVYSQAITVKLRGGTDTTGLRGIIEDLYIYYRPGVEVPTPESFAADA